MKLSVITGTQEPEATDPPAGHTQMTSLVDNLDRFVVSRFASAAARLAAIPAPTEGMYSYLTDVKRFEYWNGSGWRVVTSRVAGRMHSIGSITTINANVDTTIGMAGSDFLTGGVTYASNGITVPLAGLYLISAMIGSANGAGNAGLSGVFQTMVHRNGTRALMDVRSDNGFFFSSTLTGYVNANPNDRFTLVLFCNVACFVDGINGNGVPCTLGVELVVP